MAGDRVRGVCFPRMVSRWQETLGPISPLRDVLHARPAIIILRYQLGRVAHQIAQVCPILQHWRIIALHYQVARDCGLHFGGCAGRQQEQQHDKQPRAIQHPAPLESLPPMLY